MKITKTIKNNELTIKVKGRLDSNTSPELEKELTNLSDYDKIIFDFNNLEYISSAGLRLLLASIKQNSNIKVINVNDTVLEIFEVTGFIDILDITTK